MSKYLILSVLGFLFCTSTMGQVSLDSLKNSERASDYEAMNSSLSYDFNMLSGIPDSAGLSIASRGVSIELYFNKRFGQSRFSFVTGGGFCSRNYFSNVSYWARDSLVLLSDSLNVDKNKISVNSLSIPLELRFTSKPSGPDRNRYFVLSAGLLGEYIFDVHTKQVIDNYQVKEKGRGDLNEINSLRYGLQAKISYSNIGLGVYYGLNDLFSQDGPGSFRPYSVKVFIGI